jgi:hypothetical protein
VTSGGNVVDAFVPTDNQLCTLEESCDEPPSDVGWASILEVISEVPEPPPSGEILKSSRASVIPLSSLPRSALHIPRWLMKPGAALTIAVIQDDGTASPASVAHGLSRWIKSETKDAVQVPLIAERQSHLIAYALSCLDRDRLGSLGRRRLSVRNMDGLPIFQPKEFNGKVPRALARWWKDMFDLGTAPPNGQLLVLVTPQTASALLALADKSFAAAWAQDAIKLGHGRTFRISFNPSASKLEVTEED